MNGGPGFLAEFGPPFGVSGAEHVSICFGSTIIYHCKLYVNWPTGAVLSTCEVLSLQLACSSIVVRLIVQNVSQTQRRGRKLIKSNLWYPAFSVFSVELPGDQGIAVP